MSDADKMRLRDMRAGADPVLLLAAMRAAQADLGKRVDERGMGPGRGEAPAPIDLAQFTASLKVAWSKGEQRPTHRRRYVRVKPVVRTSMLDSVRDQLLAWLEAQPALSAVDALGRLRGLHPDQFGADHLRTVQRFMKVRRATRRCPVALRLEETRRMGLPCRLTLGGCRRPGCQGHDGADARHAHQRPDGPAGNDSR